MDGDNEKDPLVRTIMTISIEIDPVVRSRLVQSRAWDAVVRLARVCHPDLAKAKIVGIALRDILRAV